MSRPGWHDWGGPDSNWELMPVSGLGQIWASYLILLWTWICICLAWSVPWTPLLKLGTGLGLKFVFLMHTFCVCSWAKLGLVFGVGLIPNVKLMVMSPSHARKATIELLMSPLSYGGELINLSFSLVRLAGSWVELEGEPNWAGLSWLYSLV